MPPPSASGPAGPTRTDRPGPTATADLALVRAFRAREAGAVEDLGQRLRVIPNILRALNTRFGRPLDEEDLADSVQDITAIALRRLDQFDGRSELAGWLYGICRNELRNAARRRLRRPRPAEEAELELAAPVAAGDAEVDRIADDLRRGLATLTDEEREVVRLKHFDGLTFQVIAERLGLSPNTAKTRYYRGLTKLQDYMEPRRGDYQS